MKLLTQCVLTAIILGASCNTLAKQFIIINTSPDHKPISVELEVKYQNAGKPPVKGEIFTMQLIDSRSITLNEDGYQHVGVTLKAVNGHRIPDDQFQELSNYTNEDSKPITLDIAYEEYAGGHGKVSGYVH